ncbi:hypothetical protein [Synoicihabitans lomoniglobus]|uniref:hypothetical protein n=1 Tax=Synoicihabitans lomoniglobus TaxID=2909285 RepID=UPI002ED627D2|nr:hypothetical protein [Opitutaceae bacterium LMO-M01]
MAMRTRGHRLVAKLGWLTSSWNMGMRSQPAKLPLDLRESFERCRALARTYGDLIDAWEIENEPDIGFIPENAETFAAFYKACSRGIIAGREENLTILTQSHRDAKTSKAPASDLLLENLNFVTSTESGDSAVMHSPMALPPGPYWDELVANDTLRYTEAFNYHYYGYPEDFCGVRDAWIEALRHATSHPRLDDFKSEKNLELDNWILELPPKITPLPVFLTEYGYGLLDRFDRHTVEGRERQKRFFELTMPFITDGTITGAMAFVFMPYYERGINEFGLLAEVPDAFLRESKRQTSGSGPDSAPRTQDRDTIPSHSSPSLSTEVPPGGTKEKRSDRGPLLSPLLKRLETESLNPIVLDFIAGEDSRTIKRYNGHVLRRVNHRGTTSASFASPENSNLTLPSPSLEKQTSTGSFQIILYNFSDNPVTGNLSLSLGAGTITLVGRQLADASTEDSDSQSSTRRYDPRPALIKSSTSEPTQKPIPYRRPDTARSSIRPPTQRNWPHAYTPIIATNQGKIYAITPALEFLLAQGKTESIAPQMAVPVEASVKDQISKGALPTSPPITDFIPKTTRLSDLETGFESPPITLAPMERRGLEFTATLPNDNFRAHRFVATWKSKVTDSISPDEKHPDESAKSPALNSVTAGASAKEDAPSQLHSFTPSHVKIKRPAVSLLATQLYPSPAAFRFERLESFDFSAADNAKSRADQLARPLADGEAQLTQHPTAKRWLTTPGVNIEETPNSWLITVNDLPSESLRPAEIELPFPADLRLAQNAALSFKYRLVLPRQTSMSAEVPQGGTKLEPSPLPASATAENRIEEFDINFRDADGTLWTVIPRLHAKAKSQNYLEAAPNFTPMFFSRASRVIRGSLDKGGSPPDTDATSTSSSNRLATIDIRSLVIMVRPRTLPTVIEIENPNVSQLESSSIRDQNFLR